MPFSLIDPFRALWDWLDNVNVNLFVGVSSVIFGLVLLIVRYEAELAAVATGEPRINLIVDAFAQATGAPWWFLPISLIVAGVLNVRPTRLVWTHVLWSVPLIVYFTFGIYGVLTGKLISVNLISATNVGILAFWMLILTRQYYSNAARRARIYELNKQIVKTRLWTEVTYDLMDAQQLDLAYQLFAEKLQDYHATGNIGSITVRDVGAVG